METVNNRYIIEKIEPSNDTQFSDLLSIRTAIWPNSANPQAVQLYRLYLEDMQASTLPNVGQQGFIVYEDTNPAGFLQIEGIGVENNTVYQRASLLATHPELRSINLINSILQHLKDTQNTNFNYVYDAKATYKTLYTGLKKPSVEKWLKKKGVIYTFNDSLIEHSPTDDYIPMTLEFIK